MSDTYFLKFLKVIFLLSPLKNFIFRYSIYPFYSRPILVLNSTDTQVLDFEFIYF